MPLRDILEVFNLRPLEKEVFMACLESGVAGATAIARVAGISRPTVYDILDSLIQSGLVIESQKNGVKFFAVQKPEAVELLIEEKQKKILAAKSAVSALKSEFYNKNAARKPRLQIFEGKAELRQMMKDMLLYRDITAYVLWPIEKIVALLGADFYREFHRQRTERNIHIKVIWPRQQAQAKTKYNFLNDDKQLKREVRVAPAHIDFSLGYAIYANTVRFISSQKESYGFLIESQEMAEMMRRQFEIVWENCKPVRNK